MNNDTIEPVKDHVIAQAVNELRDVAILYHNSQQLRERIARVLAPLLKPKSAAAPKHEATITLPPGLDYDTGRLVARFATAMADKLYQAQVKHGYSNTWLDNDWLDECRQRLVEHVAKGDPRDVANFCAFLWHHGESTSLTFLPDRQVAPVAKAIHYPACWDTAAYPTLELALDEVYTWFKCSECEPEESQPAIDDEPTEAMLVAGLREADTLGELIDWDRSKGDCATRDDMRRVYKAMRATAST